MINLKEHIYFFKQLFQYKSYWSIYFCISKMLLKKLIFFIFYLFQINILFVFLNHFNKLILKIIFKK